MRAERARIAFAILRFLRENGRSTARPMLDEPGMDPTFDEYDKLLSVLAAMEWAGAVTSGLELNDTGIRERVYRITNYGQILYKNGLQEETVGDAIL